MHGLRSLRESLSEKHHRTAQERPESVNKDKGAVTRKACSVGCIGCGKCVKTCPFEAITLENNLAYIDPAKCRLCRKCVAVCPTGAIVEVNFPPRPAEKPAPKPAEAAQPAAKTAAVTENAPVQETKTAEEGGEQHA